MKLYQECWDDVSLQEYIDLEEINRNNRGLLARALETLCYLTDDDSWEDESPAIIIKTYTDNKWLSKTPKPKNKIEGKILKPNNKITLAEWIDLDNAIVNYQIHKIPAIMYRKYKLDEWDNYVYEPYKFSLSERADAMLDEPITNVIGVINNMIEYRDKLHKSFAELFEQYEGELEDDEKEELSPAEIKQIEKSINNDNKKKEFAWQRLLDEMSAGDWASIPGILDLPIIFILNMRTMKKLYD